MLVVMTGVFGQHGGQVTLARLHERHLLQQKRTEEFAWSSTTPPGRAADSPKRRSQHLSYPPQAGGLDLAGYQHALHYV